MRASGVKSAWVTVDGRIMRAALVRTLEERLRSTPLLNPAAVAEARRDRAGGHPVAADPREHLDAALAWLVRAQDATPDGGVSRGYSVAWNAYRRARGWQPSYPETTGYIIPTFFEAAARLERPELRKRAVRMADWEIEVQLPSGAVQGGVIGEGVEPTPAVFNTGQVMLGWLRAWRETGNAAYLEAARRGGDFLRTCQDERGAFSRAHSRFARADTTTYCTRVAWALCELGLAVDDTAYVDAARRNVEFGLSQQEPNGWFRANCLSDPERPLLHTIAYAARGILEVGLLLEDERYVDGARRTVRALADRIRPDGSLAGRFGRGWSERAEWSCLTGDAQFAVLAVRVAERDGDPRLRELARNLCRFLMRTQNRTSADPGVNGGIKGSFPFDGEYGRYELLNWAAKFFVDAMLLCFPPAAKPA